MFASLALLQSFLKHMRRGAVDAMLALPKHAPVRPSTRDEQRSLETWLFDRESRWTE